MRNYFTTRFIGGGGIFICFLPLILMGRIPFRLLPPTTRSFTLTGGENDSKKGGAGPGYSGLNLLLPDPGKRIRE
ncbi:hypothetical protein [Aneurinibacillus terranovensis]|uniref:hypothetical protein n=1 Tax=Aneurinibacillus terranovensis TaxID=278991 RepID=UPI0003F55E55|nr:hypothetical protein [Aneurinibacillus terranovensis]